MRITRGPGGRGLEFILHGGGADLRVRYRGVPPDGLRAGANVSVTGQMRAGELIAHAGGLRAGCAIQQHC
jgi:cytochrome c-type biogenesis protein CcmE